ncbi:MAG: hypothetical protein ACK5MR_02915 [Cumulibacter sp.]
MISIRRLLVIFCALSVVPSAFTQKSGWTTFKLDGTVKARGESEFKDGKLIKTKIFDSEGRLEFIEYPIYDKTGKSCSEKRILPDGNPWPYEYPIYGVAAFGGIEQLKEDIKMIQEMISRIDTKYPILEIVFLSKDRVEVTTGIINEPLNAAGRYYNLKKQRDSWQNADEEGMVRLWVS